MSTRKRWIGQTNAFTEYCQLLRDEYFQLVAGLLLVWGFCDILSTYVALSAYGTHQMELNPITRSMLSVHPLYLAMGKGFALTAVGILAVTGKDMIQSVPGWRYFYHGLLWIGIAVALTNLLAAYTALV